MSLEKHASMWAGPDGEREVFESGSGKTAEILTKLLMADEMGKKPTIVEGPAGPDVQHKGLSGEDAKLLAMEKLPASGPEQDKALLDRGWVLINDTGSQPEVLADSRENIIRAQDAVMQYLARGPVVVAFPGAEFEFSMQDMRDATDFEDALTRAQATGTVASDLGDAGMWTTAKNPEVKWI